MRNTILILGIMSNNIFFTIASIIGYEYSGSGESKIFIIYSVLVAALNILIFIIDYFRRKFSITYKDLFLLIIPFFMIANYGIVKIINSYISVYATNSILYFLLWSGVAIYIGVYVSRNNLLDSLVKYLEVIMWIFSLAIIFSLIIPFVNGKEFSSLGGSSYQTASYVSAFSYGINLYFIFYGNNHVRFKFTKVKGYNLICDLLLLFQLLGILISGGRGGIILFIVYNIYIFFSVMKRMDKKNIIKIIRFIFLSIIIILILFPILMKNHLFIEGFSRVFSFISHDGGINWSGTSGRDEIYINAINMIMKRPILGYGIYGVEGYPHNIILEILIHGGVIYLAFVLFVFICFINKLRVLIRKNCKYRIISIIFIYPIIMLLFSGTYTNFSELWFVLSLVFSCKSTIIKENKNEKNYFFCRRYF